MSLYRKMVALTLLALYASFVVTLDLHHNHSVHLPGTSAPAISVEAGDLLPLSHHHDPCPVLQFSLAHALASKAAIPHEWNLVSILIWETGTGTTRFYLTPSERAPPPA